MDIVVSGIAVAGDTFNAFWDFAVANPLLMVTLVVSLVGVAISLFYSLKSRFGARKKKGGKK